MDRSDLKKETRIARFNERKESVRRFSEVEKFWGGKKKKVFRSTKRGARLLNWGSLGHLNRQKRKNHQAFRFSHASASEKKKRKKPSSELGMD